MKPKLVIYGAGDNGGRFAFEYRELKKYPDFELVGFVDDFKRGEFAGFPILGTGKDLPHLKDNGIDQIMVSLFKDPVSRLEKCLEIEDMGFDFPSITPPVPEETYLGKGVFIHKTAVLLGLDIHLGDFSVLGPHTTVEGRTRIGKGVILAPYAFVGHDSTIGDATFLYPRSSCLPGKIIGKACKVYPHVLVHKDLADGKVKVNNLEK